MQSPPQLPLWISLDITLCRTIEGQKRIPFLGPKIWNKLSSNMKAAVTTGSFTHALKKEELQKRVSLLIFLILDYFFFALVSLGEP